MRVEYRGQKTEIRGQVKSCGLKLKAALSTTVKQRVFSF